MTKPGSLTDAKKGQVAYIFVSDKDTMTSAGKSVHYNSATKMLSFANDHVTSTTAAGDPLVGAAVNMPAFHLLAMTSNGQEFFSPSAGGKLTLSVGASTYLTASPSDLVYDRSDNLFSATLSHVFVSGVDPTSPLYDPSLAGIDSTFLHYLDAVFNPASGLFDPTATLSITYTPDSNFFADTSGFTMSAESSLTNDVSVGSVPEPPGWFLLMSGLVGFAAWRTARRSGI
jgi:MYXO-CTERM domain-containing protein